MPMPHGARPPAAPVRPLRPWPPRLTAPATLRGPNGSGRLLVILLLCLLGVALLATGAIMLINRGQDRPGQNGTPAPTSGQPRGDQPTSPDPGAQIPTSGPPPSLRSFGHRDHTLVERELRDQGFTVSTVFEPGAAGQPGDVVQVVPGENGHLVIIAVPDDKKNDNNPRTQ
jgi:hypothetical protein